MQAALKKMRFQPDMSVQIFGCPEDLVSAFSEAGIVANVPVESAAFTLVFCEQRADFDRLVPPIMDGIPFDSLLWIAYPKGTSKRYKSDLNRNAMWELLQAWDLRPVTQIAIDADWSGMRFRPNAVVKSSK
ncbi:hypothetical protein [Pontibacter sp. G13]|uniref:hypothetical protein n=1 Tax=Pontibacter sp. G13 TaxID=3074898 RepID=UPI00288957A3|nr:hypothetical protein [Pontibacter sp. G13]WNJ17653.1 hypothetical protein RJD25_22610 [Pontibacter sp. G13]